MNKIIVWTGIILLAVIIVGSLWYYLATPKQAQVSQQSPVTLPVSGSVTPMSPGTQSQAGQAMSVATQNGNAIVTKDFIHNGITTPDPSNAGNYYLTGASTNGFAIGYRTPAQYFTIALEKEPIGETRKAAENFLLSALGINQSQICSLKYYVGTDIQTNSFYAGKNLGLSFCPGATTLPQ